MIKQLIGLSPEQLRAHFTRRGIRRLEKYSNNLIDCHAIKYLLPELAKLYFSNQMGDVSVSAVQSVTNPQK